MSKVIKIFLSRGFTPVDKTVFKLGTSIAFNCYIQRFNGYAILIEAGTFLDEKMHTKLTSNNLQIYVHNQDYAEYKEYQEETKDKKDLTQENMTLEEAIQNCKEVAKNIKKEDATEEKIRILYFAGKNLLHAYFEIEDQRVPVKSLELLADSLVCLVNEKRVTLSSFNTIIEEQYTLPTHSVNVALFAALIGSQIEIDLSDQRHLVLAALLHDVGKIEIDENLLDKADLLTEDEYEIIKSHSQKSVEIVLKNGLKNRHFVAAIREHHERLDGSGYPNKLKEKRISEFGKILAVCDVFDALITVKPYRGAYSTFNALKLIQNEFKNRLELKYVHILIKLLN
jgi:putative nucleotidyltransferase with HDIG domain